LACGLLPFALLMLVFGVTLLFTLLYLITSIIGSITIFTFSSFFS
jgi:hypothetical protein